MRAVLEAYLADLRAAKATVMNELNTPATPDELALLDGLPDCTVPDDVLTLWRTFNGTSHNDDVTYGDIWLDGTFVYFSIGDTVEDYRESDGLWATDPNFEGYLPRGFLPIGTPGDGSRLLVNCRKGSPTYGAVYELFHGIGVSRHAVSLTAYFETIAALFKAGTIFVDESGGVDHDEDADMSVQTAMNPGCDAYDESLPPAYETQDWLTPEEKADLS